MQVDCVLLSRYKSVRKKNRKDDRPLPRAFSEFITYQLAMKNYETKYKSREN